MALTLRVSNGKEMSGTPAECLFEAARVTIGNSPSDAFTLPDPDDELCAGQVVLERDGAGYRITGGSALDATRVNDRVVEGRGPLPLADGDVLHVGPYALEAATEQRGTDEASVDGERPASGVPASVVEILTDAFAKALQVSRQFREEFVGHPFVHPPDAQFLYEGEGDTIREHLLDPELTGPEREQRLRSVEEAAEALALHQFAVLDGYKASVQAGLDELLGRLDPAAHRADVAETHEVFEALPALVEPVVLVRLRDECRALLREDWSVVEQRVFRPAFTKAYLEQMTAPHGTNSE